MIETQTTAPAPSYSILGTYEGECADANITNENGLDITRPVWENVFNSDLFQKAIKLGWYIGFLGHPEDPNCMDFEHACIVMTEGHIDDNGKVHGKFNLVDTPVGRIVKTFIDAGVQFGISVRGAGDIIASSVDPETFVFRGFDLVTFPAYPESIPTFSQIAASTDLEQRAKYRSVCAAVQTNLQHINSIESLNVLQAQFASQSSPYRALQLRKDEIMNGATHLDITDQKLQGMTQLYLAEVAASQALAARVDTLERELATAKRDYAQQVKCIERISASQITAIEHQYIQSNAQLKRQCQAVRSANLKYKQEIDSTVKDSQRKDTVISCLRSKLNETVTAASTSQARSSNLDETNRKLSSDLVAVNNRLSEFQHAYLRMYANAVGAVPEDVVITATTSVSDIHQAISGTSRTVTSSDSLDDMSIISKDDMVTL